LQQQYQLSIAHTTGKDLHWNQLNLKHTKEINAHYYLSYFVQLMSWMPSFLGEIGQDEIQNQIK
jgi:hypothetical protein